MDTLCFCTCAHAGTLRENSTVYCTTLRDAAAQPPCPEAPWIPGTAQLTYSVRAKPRLSADGAMDDEDSSTLEQFKRSRLNDMEPSDILSPEADDEGGMAD